MKVLIAPNTFKDAANSIEIADAIEAGVLRAQPGCSIRKMPLADGGEYSMEILLDALGGNVIEADTFDPAGETITARYGITNDFTAIIEISKASGYSFIKKNKKNPLYTSTYGTGILIKDALKRGCRKFLVALGGSGTVDGGSGILEALGVKMLDKSGQQLPRGGGNLIILNSFDTSGIERAALDSHFTLLCDVKNPLLGAEGAAMVFAPQKGADPMETMVLERCLTKFGEKCEAYSGKKLIDLEGAGAAGGTAVGLEAFFSTKLVKGTEYVLSVLGAEEHIKWADVIITAEGSLDSQTYNGKAPATLAEHAKKGMKKVICIAGKVPHRADSPDSIFDAVFSLQNQPMTIEESIRHTLENIKNTAFEIGRLL